ncbi:TolC family protein [Microbacterium sp. NPDC019599]|uniref:TolC family protein n=1 Tax=Microbacterium sp. NPDC019599 TaxID=3154690 RepID=UPI0033E239D0
MDPLWATIAEVWWIAPVAAGAGVFAMLGLKHQRAVDARRLEYDAARLELADARTRARAARSALKLARAQLSLAQAERAAGRGGAHDVAAARHGLQSAERATRAAAADLRVRRARVSTARAGLAATSDPAHRPLARVTALHDSLTARWMEYETDPARVIMFPVMSDARVPETAAHFVARAEAQRLRPGSATARITPVQFAEYRNAVEHLARTFEAAEREAWRQARASGMAPPEPRADPVAQWSDAAQEFLARSTEAIARASESAAALAARFGVRPTVGADEDRRDEPGPGASRPAPSPSPAPSAPAPEPVRAVWPVPARGAQRPAS